MFELHQFFPLIELAWQVDPNKTAEVLAVLMQQASDRNLSAMEVLLHQTLIELAEGRSPSGVVFHGNDLVEKFGPPKPP